MMFWGVPAATVATADLEPRSSIASPASTTIPLEMHPNVRWSGEESLLALSSTTTDAIELMIEASSTSSAAGGHLPPEEFVDEGVEEEPVAIRLRPKAAMRMKGRVVRVSRPRYAAAGLPAAGDILDDE